MIVGTNRQLVQDNNRVPSRRLVVNLTTGEIRRGPGNGWDELAAAGGEDLADVVVRVATTANITIATALVTGETLDGETLAAGDLVLVKDQSTPAQNGIYVVGATPARSADWNTYAGHAGTVVHVEEGTANEGLQYICTSGKTGTLGTTALAFARFTGPLQNTVRGLSAAAAAVGTQRLVVLNADGSLQTVTAEQLKTFSNA